MSGCNWDEWSKGWFRQLADNPMWAKIRTGANAPDGEPVFFGDGPVEVESVPEPVDEVASEPEPEPEPVKPSRRSRRSGGE